MEESGGRVRSRLAADYGRTVVVPMTLVNGEYREEIFGQIARAGVPLLHVFLEVPAEELRRRIDAQVLHEDPRTDADSRAFRHKNVDRCVAARDSLSTDTWCSGVTSTPRPSSPTVC